MSSSEVWYGVTHAEIVKLEQIDEMVWLNILECSSLVPRDLIYLELGILRIRDIIITRRLMFLHHIMKQEKESLIYRFFIAQARSPTQNDWVSQVLKDLEDIELEIEFKDICSLSKDKFKEIVNEHVLKFSYSQLIQKKQNRTSDNAKGRNIKYNCFDMQDYLKETECILSLDDKKWIFKCRTDDIDLQGNFQWKYSSNLCISCDESCIEDNEHLLTCKKLLGKNEIISYIPEYKELFENNLDEMIYVSRILRENFKNRKRFMP